MIPADKVMHLAAGALVAAVLLLLGLSPADACCAALVVGILKELYDMRHRDVHTPDVWDAVATAGGGLLLVGLLLLIPSRLHVDDHAACSSRGPRDAVGVVAAAPLRVVGVTGVGPRREGVPGYCAATSAHAWRVSGVFARCAWTHAST